MKTAWIALAGVAAGSLFVAIAVASDGRAVPVALVLYLVGFLLVSRFLKASRRAAVEAEARRLGLSFSRKDPFRVLDSDFHPFLHFGKLPGTQGVENVVWGERAGREVRAFEYWRPAEDGRSGIPARWSGSRRGGRPCWSVGTALSTSRAGPRGSAAKSSSLRPSTGSSRFVRTIAGWPRRWSTRG